MHMFYSSTVCDSDTRETVDMVSTLKKREQRMIGCTNTMQCLVAATKNDRLYYAVFGCNCS